MGEIVEIQWDRSLEERLAEWLVRFGQLTPIGPGDMDTEEMIALTLRRRIAEARQAVKRLRTVIGGHAVPVLDLQVMEAVEKLRIAACRQGDTLGGHEKQKKEGESECAMPAAAGHGPAGEGMEAQARAERPRGGKFARGLLADVAGVGAGAAPAAGTVEICAKAH
jgi:hypothetical protein